MYHFNLIMNLCKVGDCKVMKSYALHNKVMVLGHFDPAPLVFWMQLTPSSRREAWVQESPSLKLYDSSWVWEKMKGKMRVLVLLQSYYRAPSSQRNRADDGKWECYSLLSLRLLLGWRAVHDCVTCLHIANHFEAPGHDYLWGTIQ